jgi:hypothetical protein
VSEACIISCNISQPLAAQTFDGSEESQQAINSD